MLQPIDMQARITDGTRVSMTMSLASNNLSPLECFGATAHAAPQVDGAEELCLVLGRAHDQANR
jgi:hypothetical protein